MADEIKGSPRPNRDELLRIAYRAAGRHSDIAKAVDGILAAIDGTATEPPAPAAIVAWTDSFDGPSYVELFQSKEDAVAFVADVGGEYIEVGRWAWHRASGSAGDAGREKT